MIAPLFGIHDATSGFHDIKPLPIFSPIDWRFVGLVGLIAALIIALALYRRKQRQTPATPSQPPRDTARAALAALRSQALNGEIPLRELSTAVSVVVRHYLEQTFKFSATDETTNEILRHLNRALTTTAEKKESLMLLTTELLRFLDYLTFSEDSEQRFTANHQEVLRQLDSVDALINDYELFVPNIAGGA